MAIDGKFAMHQALSIRRHHVVAGLGAKNFLVKLHRGHAIINN
jgi:hypothetical protein